MYIVTPKERISNLLGRSNLDFSEEELQKINDNKKCIFDNCLNYRDYISHKAVLNCCFKFYNNRFENRNEFCDEYLSMCNYLEKDNISFENFVSVLNKKYENINNKILNKYLIDEINELTTYFSQWDLGTEESKICTQLGNNLLENIDKCKNKKEIINSIEEKFSILDLNNKIWNLLTIKKMIFTGYIIFINTKKIQKKKK